MKNLIDITSDIHSENIFKSNKNIFWKNWILTQKNDYLIIAWDINSSISWIEKSFDDIIENTTYKKIIVTFFIRTSVSSLRSTYFLFFITILSSVMVLLTGLLFFEYRFFVRQLDELTQLKQEYDNYLLLFKRMILQEENQDSDKDEQEGIAKKK